MTRNYRVSFDREFIGEGRTDKQCRLIRGDIMLILHTYGEGIFSAGRFETVSISLPNNLDKREEYLNQLAAVIDKARDELQEEKRQRDIRELQKQQQEEVVIKMPKQA